MKITSLHKVYKKPAIYSIRRTEFPNFELYDEYKMFNIGTNEEIGIIQFTPSFRKVSKTAPKERSLYIDFINTKYRNQGCGRTLINLAKCISRKSGLRGNLHLWSSGCYEPSNPPHLFYKKLGFKTNSKILNNFFDFCIKHNLKLPGVFAPNVQMYK